MIGIRTFDHIRLILVPSALFIGFVDFMMKRPLVNFR
jgi:hypothetical protein